MNSLRMISYYKKYFAHRACKEQDSLPIFLYRNLLEEEHECVALRHNKERTGCVRPFQGNSCLILSFSP